MGGLEALVVGFCPGEEDAKARSRVDGFDGRLMGSCPLVRRAPGCNVAGWLKLLRKLSMLFAVFVNLLHCGCEGGSGF